MPSASFALIVTLSLRLNLVTAGIAHRSSVEVRQALLSSWPFPKFSSVLSCALTVACGPYF